MIFFPRGDPIRFGEDTCEGSAGVFNEGRNERTDRSFPLWVMQFGNVMSPLILKVRCTAVRIMKKNVFRGAYFHT